MVIKKSFNALAISVGSVYVVFSYLIDVGDCLGALLDGIRLFRTFACCFGFFFVCSSWLVICCFLACLISVFSLFLKRACFWMLISVGYLIFCSCSLCCFLIFRLIVGLHHGFLGGFGIFSYCSIVCEQYNCMLLSCSFVLSVVSRSSVIRFLMAVKMVSFFFSYWCIVSVGLLLVLSLCSVLWNVA